MDRRPLSLLLAAALLAAVPAGAAGASIESLLAGSPSGTLVESPSDEGLTAAAPKGTLSDSPSEASASGTDSGDDTSTGATATAGSLPFTGSDPRITLLLGVAAVLAGAGLRLRTGDARDF